jgi:PII-like signaling protein
MDVHPKKKIEVLVETPIVRRVLEIMQECGAKGATVLPILRGQGQSGDWSDKDPGSATEMQMVMVITGPRRAEVIRDTVYAALTDYRGMILISDVEVIRNEHF